LLSSLLNVVDLSARTKSLSWSRRIEKNVSRLITKNELTKKLSVEELRGSWEISKKRKTSRPLK
jgi:hypothetical protein